MPCLGNVRVGAVYRSDFSHPGVAVPDLRLYAVL